MGLVIMVLMLGMATDISGMQKVAASPPCGASSMIVRYQPERLRSYGNFELLSFFTAESQEQNREASDSYLEDVKREIVARRSVSELVCVMETSDSFPQLGYTSGLLSEISDRSLDHRLRVLATADVSERSYFTLVYFARGGSVWALELLNANFNRYPVPSYVWTDAVELIGEYRYFPAAHNLVETIGAFYLSLSYASLRNLELMFPGFHPSFSNFDEARDYWLRYVSENTK